MTIWDDNEFPQAYLITFRTYGSWLHGDERGSIDRYHNAFRGSRVPTNHIMHRQQIAKLKYNAIKLNTAQRSVVKHAIYKVCAHRGWKIFAINIRTNHIHVVVWAQVSPEILVRDFKSYSTRALRQRSLWSYKHSPWVDGSSKRFLWKERSVENACEYVINGQGDDLPESF
jgi:REP element-mobilizing transposase RayT